MSLDGIGQYVEKTSTMKEFTKPSFSYRDTSPSGVQAYVDKVHAAVEAFCKNGTDLLYKPLEEVVDDWAKHCDEPTEFEVLARRLGIGPTVSLPPTPPASPYINPYARGQGTLYRRTSARPIPMRTPSWTSQSSTASLESSSVRKKKAMLVKALRARKFCCHVIRESCGDVVLALIKGIPFQDCYSQWQRFLETQSYNRFVTLARTAKKLFNRKIQNQRSAKNFILEMQKDAVQPGKSNSRPAAGSNPLHSRPGRA